MMVQKNETFVQELAQTEVVQLVKQKTEEIIVRRNDEADGERQQAERRAREEEAQRLEAERVAEEEAEKRTAEELKTKQEADRAQAKKVDEGLSQDLTAKVTEKTREITQIEKESQLVKENEEKEAKAKEDGEKEEKEAHEAKEKAEKKA